MPRKVERTCPTNADLMVAAKAFATAASIAWINMDGKTARLHERAVAMTREIIATNIDTRKDATHEHR